MKFRHILFANLFRRKLRTALTIGSFAVALFLFGMLVVIRGAFTRFNDVAGADRLIVVSRNSPLFPLPMAYRERLLRVPGVRQVTSTWWTPGFYQDDRIFFVTAAIDVEHHREVFSELVVPEDQWVAFVADREGCIVGESLARRYNWKVGDRIPVKGPISRGKAWEYNIRGIYRGTRPQHDTGHFWFSMKALEERNLGFKGIAGWYLVRVANRDAIPQIVKAIDLEFANSPRETKTNTENEFGSSVSRQLGNIEFIILSVGAVVFFTLLLVTGNTMAIAIRERTGELAVIKALGFSDITVLVMVLVESTTIAAVGGALGLVGAKLYTLRGDPTRGLLPVFHMPGAAVAEGLALALLVGFLAGLVPAVSAMRLRVVHAIRRV